MQPIQSVVRIWGGEGGRDWAAIQNEQPILLLSLMKRSSPVWKQVVSTSHKTSVKDTGAGQQAGSLSYGLQYIYKNNTVFEIPDKKHYQTLTLPPSMVNELCSTL